VEIGLLQLLNCYDVNVAWTVDRSNANIVNAHGREELKSWSSQVRNWSRLWRL